MSEAVSSENSNKRLKQQAGEAMEGTLSLDVCAEFDPIRLEMLLTF